MFSESLSISAKRLASVGLVAFLTLCGGCASNSNFLSGKPIEKGKVDMYAAISNIGFTQDTLLGDADIAPTGFFFELGADAGITEKFSAGFKYTFPTAGSINGKYTLIGAGKETGFFGAGGLRGGYTAFPTTDSTENNRIEYAVPIFLSYYPSDFFGITLTPTYGGRYFTEGEYTNLAGGNVNLMIGRRFGAVFDFGFYRNFRYNWNELQGGIAFRYGLEGLF
jgi:hypothetical protein